MTIQIRFKTPTELHNRNLRLGGRNSGAGLAESGGRKLSSGSQPVVHILGGRDASEKARQRQGEREGKTVAAEIFKQPGDNVIKLFSFVADDEAQ